MNFFVYLASRWDSLLEKAVDHIQIVIVAVIISSIIGVGIGVLTYRTTWASQLAISIAGAFLTIPSLALLGLLIPIMGLGYWPALTALVLYGLLPIIRNTITGLNGVDPKLIEAARGMGMSKRKVLRSVELPIAWPVILTGIRVATQFTVGIAAVAAYVNGPGLGRDIFSGLSRIGGANAINLALGGTLGIAVLALIFEGLFMLISRFSVPRGLRG